MKKLIVGLLLSIGLVGIANADSILYTLDNQQNLIIITDELGSCPIGNFWYRINSDGATITQGCWLLSDTNKDQIVAVESTGGMHLWNMNDFISTTYGHDVYGFNY